MFTKVVKKLKLLSPYFLFGTNRFNCFLDEILQVKKLKRTTLLYNNKTDELFHKMFKMLRHSNSKSSQTTLNDLIDIIYKDLRQRSPKKDLSAFYIHSVIYIFKFVKKTRLVLRNIKCHLKQVILTKPL